jgi:hypothetical protein
MTMEEWEREQELLRFYGLPGTPSGEQGSAGAGTPAEQRRSQQSSGAHAPLPPQQLEHSPRLLQEGLAQRRFEHLQHQQSSQVTQQQQPPAGLVQPGPAGSQQRSQQLHDSEGRQATQQQQPAGPPQPGPAAGSSQQWQADQQDGFTDRWEVDAGNRWAWRYRPEEGGSWWEVQEDGSLWWLEERPDLPPEASLVPAPCGCVCQAVGCGRACGGHRMAASVQTQHCSSGKRGTNGALMPCWTVGSWPGARSASVTKM